MLSYIWLSCAILANMPHVASGGAVSVLLQAAMDERGFHKRTLARKLAEENGGTVDSWRSQVVRILAGQQPRRDTVVKLARALDKPDDYLVEDADPKFSTALLGQLVLLMERGPEFRRMRPDLLRELAAEMHDLAARLEALAASSQDAETPPGPHG